MKSPLGGAARERAASTDTSPRAQNTWALVGIAFSVFMLAAITSFRLRGGAEGVETGVLSSPVVAFYRLLGFEPAFMCCVLVLAWSSIWFLTGRMERPWARIGKVFVLGLCLSILVNLRADGSVAPDASILGGFFAARLYGVFGFLLSTIVVSAGAIVMLFKVTDHFFIRYFESSAVRNARAADGKAAALTPSRLAGAGGDDEGVEAQAVDELQSLRLQGGAVEPAAASSAATSTPAAATPSTSSSAAAEPGMSGAQGATAKHLVSRGGVRLLGPEPEIHSDYRPASRREARRRARTQDDGADAVSPAEPATVDPEVAGTAGQGHESTAEAWDADAAGDTVSFAAPHATEEPTEAQPWWPGRDEAGAAGAVGASAGQAEPSPSAAESGVGDQSADAPSVDARDAEESGAAGSTTDDASALQSASEDELSAEVDEVLSGGIEIGELDHAEQQKGRKPSGAAPQHPLLFPASQLDPAADTPAETEAAEEAAAREPAEGVAGEMLDDESELLAEMAALEATGEETDRVIDPDDLAEMVTNAAAELEREFGTEADHTHANDGAAADASTPPTGASNEAASDEDAAPFASTPPVPQSDANSAATASESDPLEVEEHVASAASDIESAQPDLTQPKSAHPEDAQAQDDAGEPTVEIPAVAPSGVAPAPPQVGPEPVADNAHASVDPELVEAAADLVVGHRRASASFLKRRLRVSEDDAVALLGALSSRGVIECEPGAAQGRVLIDLEEWESSRGA